jgi:hypothetical protein
MQHNLTQLLRRPLGFLSALVLGIGLLASGAALAQNAPAGNDDEDESLEVTGIIDGTPFAVTGDRFGIWTIDGVDYRAVRGVTRFEDVDQLTIGSCAEVKYRVTNIGNNIGKISASDDCEGNGDDDNGTPDPGQGTPQPPEDEDEDDESFEGYDDAYSDEFKGVVVDFPAALVGEWVISSTTSSETYTATFATRFQQRKGPFRVGACVEAKTNGAGSNFLKEIKTDDGCRGSAAASYARLTGVLSSLPDDPNLIGEWSINWTISSTTFISTVVVVPTTTLEADHGPFYVGACVNLQYDRTSLIARRAETEGFGDCGTRSTIRPGGVVTLTDGTTVTIAVGAPISTTYGLIEARPEEPQIFGVWTISGTNYEAITGTTGFELEHGPLSVGECVKLRYFADTIVAARIESEEDYKCTGIRTGRLAEVHGVVNFRPEGTDYGVWQIGDLFYDAVTGTTEIEGSPTISSIVEVKFAPQPDGTLLAYRIKAKDIDDDDRRGGKSYGLVESRPLSPTNFGEWTIGGATYSATAQTRVRGALEIGDCAEVYYSFPASGEARIAHKIKAEDEHCAPPPPPGEAVTQSIYGFVDDLPVSGYIGTWLVTGSPYEADAQTTFDAKGGTFVIGSFVEVTYIVTDGVNSALHIEAHVPPNGGDVTVPSGTLTISGTEYFIDEEPIEIVDATLIDDDAGDIEDGAIVYVNYYTETVTPGERAARGVAAGEVRTVTKLVTSGTTTTATPTPTPGPGTPSVTPTATATRTPTPTRDPALPTLTPTATIDPAQTNKIYVPTLMRSN